MTKTQCTICHHASIREINSRIIKGELLRTLSNEFKVSISALYRHKQSHLPATLLKGLERLNVKESIELAKESIEIEKLEIADSFDAITSLNFVVVELKQILEETKAGKMHALSIKALDSLRNSYIGLVTLLEQAKATYEAKLELLKLQNHEELKEAQRIADEKMKIPTFDELQVYLRVLNKMLYDNGDIIIKGDKVVPSLRDIENIHHD